MSRTVALVPKDDRFEWSVIVAIEKDNPKFCRSRPGFNAPMMLLREVHVLNMQHDDTMG